MNGRLFGKVRQVGVWLLDVDSAVHVSDGRMQVPGKRLLVRAVLDGQLVGLYNKK